MKRCEEEQERVVGERRRRVSANCGSLISRREFLQQTAAGGIGLLASGSLLQYAPAEKEKGYSMDSLRECHEYCKMLRAEMDRWLAQSTRMDGPGPHGGGEDEANYALAWFPHYLVTGSPKVKKHFQHLLDCLAGWVERECLHGYEPEAEAHHGTEPFLLFLPRYIGLFPEDERAKSLLEDAAHHIGNWVKGIPEWYDYDHDCFYSYHLGTRTVRREPRFEYEVAEHFRPSEPQEKTSLIPVIRVPSVAPQDAPRRTTRSGRRRT